MITIRLGMSLLGKLHSHSSFANSLVRRLDLVIVRLGGISSIGTDREGELPETRFTVDGLHCSLV